MLAKAVLITPKDKDFIFDLEELTAFYDGSTNSKDIVNLYLSYQTSPIAIEFTFAEFEERFLKYKRGRIEDSDLVQDDDGNPVLRLVRMFTP